VRAEVAEADHSAFDHWYETEHLPDANAGFQALAARRGWSAVTPGVHFAIYEFSDLAQARKANESDAMKGFAVEFENAWGDRVRRSREIIDVTQTI